MTYARVWVLAAAFALGAGADAVVAQTTPDQVEAGSDAGLDLWIAEFRARALEAGIKADVFDAAFAGVSYDENVIRRDRNQSEFTKTIWEYLETAASNLRIANGKKALESQRAALEKIEAQYGVDKEVIVAIWGLESAYGTFRGRDSVIRSLASLAYDGRRQAFFEAELMDALRILQAGDTSPAQMTGSWAGAMGHTQFMPSSFQLYAVDFTGDSRRDIWGDDPRDALASTAAYLKHFGWTLGQPWGVEVTLPDGFDYLLANREILKAPEEWAALGVVGVSGKAVPNHGPASILLPGGAEGAVFMIFSNFEVIERYNTADAYVIGVGHLSDRIAGSKPIAQGWPVQDRALTFDERIELQTRLTALGFDTVKIDAKIGPLTINAVRDFQVAQGLLPDGYASPRFLDSVRAAR
ncbi:MAG: lytic murein transglycosylase [Sulfitobacter sp.]|nr:lytic murein transglycosylase [Sulfitobacter sp.]